MKPDLVALMAELQRDLRLLDWRIEVSYVPNLCTSSGYPVHGLCSHLVDAKRARIQIRDPETPATENDPSVEETLVHELVHLHFAPFSGNTQPEIAAEEQAVWAIAEAITNAKTAARRGQIARAMAARARERFTAGGRTKERKMDPAVIAALLALLESDPEAAKDYLKKLQGGGGGGEGAAPPAAQQPPPEEPRMQAPPAEEPRAARAVPTAQGSTVSRQEFEQLQTEQLVHQHGASLSDEQRRFALTLAPTAVRSYLATLTSGAPAPASAAQAHTRAAATPSASSTTAAPPAGVTRGEFERYRVDQYIELHGSSLNEAQKKFAQTLTYEQVRGYIATTVPSSTPAAQRNTAPAQGPRRQMSVDPTIQEVDRRMGLAPVPTQAIGRDPTTGRLTISNIAPAKVVKAAAAQTGGE